jgi:hypothetical protein
MKNWFNKYFFNKNEFHENATNQIKTILESKLKRKLTYYEEKIFSIERSGIAYEMILDTINNSSNNEELIRYTENVSYEYLQTSEEMKVAYIFLTKVERLMVEKSENENFEIIKTHFKKGEFRKGGFHIYEFLNKYIELRVEPLESELENF